MRETGGKLRTCFSELCTPNRHPIRSSYRGGRMKQTVLHKKHLQLNAKFTEYQEWQTPLQFSDVLDEYHAVRTAAGLFDIGYLGRIEITGSGAVPFLQKVLTRNIA